MQFRVIVVTDPQTHTETHPPTNTQRNKPTDRTDYNTLRRSLPRWLSWLRHSAHRPGRSAGGAVVQSPGRPVDFVFGFQGRML